MTTIVDQLPQFAAAVGADVKSLKTRLTAVEASQSSNPLSSPLIDLGSIADTPTQVFNMGTIS